MLNRRESQDNKLPPKPGGTEPSKPRMRIGRACDRCKIKKSKCDGNTPCSNCIANDSICEYSARRRREARDWYMGMQDVMDEALQRLYWACREGRGFPGLIPDESSGRVSTDAILRGLGLNPPPVDGARSFGSRSDSVVETQAQLFLPQSYPPPDVQPQPSTFPHHRPVSSTFASTFSTRGERHPLADGTPDSGREGNRPFMMDVEVEVEEEDMPDGIDNTLLNSTTGVFADGLGGQLEGRVGGGIGVHSSMLQDESVTFMESPIYASTSAGQFGVSLSSAAHGRQMSMQSVNSQFQISNLEHESLASAEQRRWTDDHQVYEPDETLPWPGTMASVHRNKKDKRRDTTFEGAGERGG